jgi:hypothetical protein
MATRTFTHWIRIVVALIALLLGVLLLVSGLFGSEPVRIAGSGNVYYQIVVNPPAYYLLWGSLSLLIAAGLFLWPSLSKRKN